MNFRYDTNDEKLVVSGSTRIEYHQMQLWLERYVKGYKFMPAFKLGVWNGKQSYFDNGKVNLGLWRECFKACKEIGVTFNIENRDEFPLDRDITLDKVNEFCIEFFKNHKVKDKDGNWVQFMPYDYQIETAYKILKNRYCLASVATSGGKSLIISIVYFYTLKKINPDAKLLIIVPSITLVSQFYDNILEYNYGFNFLKKYSDKVDFRNHLIDEILSEESTYDPCVVRMEEVMSDRPRKFVGPYPPNVYIGTYQSLDKYPKEFFHQFHTVACDESHQAKATTLKSILSRTFKHAYHRFGVSGTFPTEESLEILSIQSVLGPIITEVSADELVKRGAITAMSVKVVVMNHNEKELSEKLNIARKTGAGAEVFRYEKDFIQASDKRLSFIKKLVAKCDKNTLLLFHTIEYGKRILEELSKEFTDKEFYYIDGEVSGKKREEIKKLMEITGDKPKILIASFGTLSTGVSIRNLHYLIMADSFKSEQIIIQSIGRLLRLFEGKEKAIIFDLVDIFDESMNNILYSHYKERKKFYDKRKYPYKEIKVNL
jgi:superfamily II DNA or RNA helicase